MPALSGAHLQPIADFPLLVPVGAIGATFPANDRVCSASVLAVKTNPALIEALVAPALLT
eukprot:2697533-Heterocapsa_arctica.AAC.1